MLYKRTMYSPLRGFAHAPTFLSAYITMLITTLIALADYATMPCCKEGGTKPEGRETEGSEASSRGAGDRGAEAGRQRA